MGTRLETPPIVPRLCPRRMLPYDWSAALLSSAPKVLAVSLLVLELMATSLCRHTKIQRRQ